MLGLAFIIPAYKIFEDIESRFGEEPLLCHSPAVIQPYNALNDIENAEQRLLDPIKGKGAGTLILLHGLPRVNNTVTDVAIVPYDHWAVHSNVCGELGDKNASLKEILELMLRYQRYGAIWTLLRRAAPYLKIVVQEAPDGRTVFSRGDLLEMGLIMTGTPNGRMLATFSATAFSAQPSSFALSVPSIDVHNYIDCYHKTPNDLAAVEIHERLTKEMMV